QQSAAQKCLDMSDLPRELWLPDTEPSCSLPYASNLGNLCEATQRGKGQGNVSSFMTAYRIDLLDMPGEESYGGRKPLSLQRQHDAVACPLDERHGHFGFHSAYCSSNARYGPAH